jgi:hypothetical protein
MMTTPCPTLVKLPPAVPFPPLLGSGTAVLGSGAGALGCADGAAVEFDAGW